MRSVTFDQKVSSDEIFAEIQSRLQEEAEVFQVERLETDDFEEKLRQAEKDAGIN